MSFRFALCVVLASLLWAAGLLNARAEAAETGMARGFFQDLSPLIGGSGRVRGIANGANAFTGNRFDEQGDAEAFVWTRAEGYTPLPPPEGGKYTRGMLVSEDGKVVAGLAADVDIKDSHSGALVTCLVVWGQSERPAFSGRDAGAMGATVAGISPDGSVVAGYSEMGRYVEQSDHSLEFEGRFGGFTVSGGKFYYLDGTCPKDKEGGGSHVIAMGGDAKVYLLGEFANDGKRLIDGGGKTIREYGLGRLPEKFPRGFRIGGHIMRDGNVFGLRTQAINADGSVAGGQLITIDHATGGIDYFPVYWDKEGEIHFISHDTEYAVDAVSDDGKTMLLSHDFDVAVWREGRGTTRLPALFAEYGIDTGRADPRMAEAVHMSRDGQCLSGGMFYKEQGGEKVRVPFVACFGDHKPLF